MLVVGPCGIHGHIVLVVLVVVVGPCGIHGPVVVEPYGIHVLFLLLLLSLLKTHANSTH